MIFVSFFKSKIIIGMRRFKLKKKRNILTGPNMSWVTVKIFHTLNFNFPQNGIESEFTLLCGVQI